MYNNNMAEPNFHIQDIGHFTDIETALRENELKNQQFLDSSPVAIYSCDAMGYITFYNSAAATLWGRSPEIGKDLWCGSWRIYDPEGNSLSLDHCPMAMTLKEKRPFYGQEIIIKRPDGSLRNVLPYPTPVFNSAGVLTGAVNTLVDITEQKKGEEKQGILAAIINSSQDAIVSKTLKGIITSWNHGAATIFGYSEAEMLGKHISILIPPERIEEETLIIDRISKGENVAHFITERRAKSGKIIPVSLTVSPVKDAAGNIIGASKVARDISEQMEAQKQLKQYADKLEQMNRYKDDFICMASHELKTPLTSIKANLQVLQRQVTDNTSSRFLNKTVHHVSKLSELISELLDVTKIEAGNLALEMSHFELNSLVEESIEGVQLSTLHDIQYVAPAKEIMVDADRIRIEQVLINLLTNAVKYSPMADKILVECQIKENETIISVRDFGIGIPAPQQGKIFSRFYRVEGLAPTFPGLGLGLYISNDIVQRHKGKMWVKSKEGEGSTFYFSIPNKKS